MPAQTANESLVASLRWRSIGPHRGGRVVAVAGDVSNRETFYMGACAGGVWKTTDGGVIWRNVSDGFFNTAAVGAIAVSESDPNVVYAGTGETAIRGNVSHGDGVYKSTDGGKTWANVGLKDSRHIGDIVIHPRNPDLVYVAALGHVWGQNEERGVFRTKDGGKSWEKVLYKSDKAGSHELAMDPSNPRIIYAAIWDAQRYPHALRSGGPDSGIYKTTDGGDTWTEITRNGPEGARLPRGVLGKIGLAVSGAKDGRVWALVEAHDGALYRSDDGGETWERLSEEPYLRTRAWYYMHIYADPQDADTVWILNYNIHKSIDGGKTFSEVPSRHGDEHDLWIDPHDTRRMVKGDDGGACVSYNGGQSWSSIFNQPTAQLYHVTTDDGTPYRVYGSQQDNSAISVPSATVEGAIHERDWFEPGGGESGYIALKPGDANIMVAGAIGSGNFNGRLIHYNRTTGQHRNITVWPELAGMGSGAESLKYRFQWTFPVFWSQHEQDALYVAGNRIFKSLDEGRSWEVVSEDLTRNDPETLKASGGPITKDNTGAEAYGTIFALEESPHQRGLLWAGTDDGLVKISEDGGKTWQDITPKDLPEWALISIIDLSKHDAGTAYMAATRYKSHDQKPYLFKTKDFGTNWTLIANGIPEDDFTRVIREDHQQPGLLFCGTETGLYVSFDDGENWQRMGGNFPVCPVHDLIVKDDNLVVATHGRSFWILDDLTPLRRIAAGAAEADGAVIVFPSAPKARMKVYPGFGSEPAAGYVSYKGVGTSHYAFEVVDKHDGTTEPRLLDAGENPPVGLVVQYYLREKAQEPIALTVRDSKGNEVRTFSSKKEKEVPAEVDTEGAEGAEGGSVDEEPKGETYVPANAGLNRFEWDMRYAPAETAEGMDLKPWEKPLGPVVLPGTYTVELK
ncbi:MAG: VPS10 domain-containing protein, partial [Vicinamibacterales bacterium]